MATTPKPTPVKSAKIKPAKGTPPENLNTKGKIVPKTAPAPKGASTNPARPDVSKTHDYLDSVKTKDDIKSEMGRLNKELSTAQADKNYVRATQLKDAKAGLADKASAAGMKPSDFPAGALSISIETAQALGAASGSLEGALEKRAYNASMAQMAAMARKAKTNGGGYVVEKNNPKLDWNAVVPKKGKYKGESREDHVRRHNKDDLSKENHGVFNGDGVDKTNKAWERAKELGLSPNAKGELIVPMGQQVGTSGGALGTGAPLSNVRIIVEPGTSNIITSMPF
jgi:hypothetical protein